MMLLGLGYAYDCNNRNKPSNHCGSKTQLPLIIE